MPASMRGPKRSVGDCNESVDARFDPLGATWLTGAGSAEAVREALAAHRARMHSFELANGNEAA